MLAAFLAYPSFCSTFSLESLNRFWAGLSGPVMSLMLQTASHPLPYPIDNQRVHINVPLIQPLIGNTDHLMGMEEGTHDNFLVKAVTFGNKESLRHPNTVYILGSNYIPYAVFVYGANDSFYLAKHLDAPSVLLYGYAWTINIPSRILEMLDGLTERERDYKFLLAIDVLFSILSAVVEAFFMFWNTILGFFIALLFHPWDSLCSILGAIYFAIFSTISAAWGVVSNIFLIPYHIIK